MGKKEKNDVNIRFGKMKIKTWFVCFFKCSLNFRAHALQFELNNVGYTNFAKFQLQIISFKIGQAFEKTNKPCFYLHFSNLNFKIFFSAFSLYLFF